MPSMFAYDGASTLSKLDLHAYEKEFHLQELISRFPELLVADLVSVEDSPRWMLVEREFKVPGVIDTGGTFKLDAVFLDQDGTPVLVEVKRAANTQIKREVVGQILDYARCFLDNVDSNSLRSRFVARCGGEEAASSELSRHLLGAMSPEEFWDSVTESLKSRRLRLVIVADDIRPELRLLLQFLDEQMDSIEIFAVKVSQYVNKDLNTRFMLSEATRLQDPARPTARAEVPAPAPQSSNEWSEIVKFNRDPAMQEILLREALVQRTSPTVRKIYYDADGVMRWRLQVQRRDVNMYQQMRFEGDYARWKGMFPGIEIRLPGDGSQLSFNLRNPEELEKFLQFAKSADAEKLRFLPRGVKGEMSTGS